MITLYTPPQAAESLRAIRSASPQGLDELRATLAAQPRHGLGSPPELVAATNVDGLSTSLAITGEPYPLASNVDTAAYRIVQEALTNVVRHANARQHVSRALIKLGARDRAQLVVLACQSGIPVPTL